MYNWITELVVGFLENFANISSLIPEKEKDESNEEKPKFIKAFIIIPVVIIAVTFIFYAFISPMQKKHNTKDTLGAISYLLETEKEETHSYPTEIESLLRRNPTYGDLSIDSWGSPIIYSLDDTGTHYTLISTGKDLLLNTEDDIILHTPTKQ